MRHEITIKEPTKPIFNPFLCVTRRVVVKQKCNFAKCNIKIKKTKGKNMNKEERLNKLKEMRASQQDFPIIRENTEVLLTKVVETKKPMLILELGTGKGYSGSVMLTAHDGAGLVTIERDTDNYHEAVTSFANLEFFERIIPINATAEEVVDKMHDALHLEDGKGAQGQQFDLIFLDCNKSSYNKMIDKLIDLLAPEGVLFVDNVLYHGMVNNGEYPKHKHRTIVLSLREFIEKCKNDNRLENVALYEFDDGALVATKKAN